MSLPVIHVSSFREGQAIVKRMKHEANIQIALALKNREYSNTTIAKLMDIPENYVRSLTAK